MSIEYRDGRFSKNMPLDEAIRRFQGESEREPEYLKALHIGTEEELNDLKSRSIWNMIEEDEKEVDLQSQINELRGRVDAMEQSKSTLIEIPTQEQIRQFVKSSLIKN